MVLFPLQLRKGLHVQQALKEKLEQVVERVTNTMVDPDIDIDYFIPEIAVTTTDEEKGEFPYILVKYAEDKYVDRRIPLKVDYMEKSAEEIANLVTFHIEQFKEEVDSLHYGAQ